MKKTILALAMAALTLSVAAGNVIKRGAAIKPGASALSVKDILAKPADFSEKPVVIEGLVEQACTTKGCWMQLASEPGTAPVRVTFKNYGFFVPLDSKGMDARMEGVTRIKVLSKADADHLEAEGAKLKRNSDGTANEISFVASGVELRKPIAK